MTKPRRRYVSPDELGRNATESLVAGRDFAFSRDLDRRSVGYRCYRDLQGEIVSDLGGSAHLTALQHRLVQHASALSAFVEAEEVRLLSGEALRYPDLYIAGLNAFNRLARTLGIYRRPREVTGLDEYLAAKAKKEEIEE
jgi:hypothetical protein